MEARHILIPVERTDESEIALLTLADIEAQLPFFFRPDDAALAPDVIKRLADAEARKVVSAFRQYLEAEERLDADVFRALMKHVQKSTNIKGRSLWDDARRRLLRNKGAVASLILLAVLVLAAAVASVLYPENPILGLSGSDVVRSLVRREMTRLRNESEDAGMKTEVLPRLTALAAVAGRGGACGAATGRRLPGQRQRRRFRLGALRGGGAAAPDRVRLGLGGGRLRARHTRAARWQHR